LVLTLITTTVIGILLASYLSLIAAQNRSITRSQAWNACIPVLETGIEEALTQINRKYPVRRLGSDGWTLDPDGYYRKTRSLDKTNFCVTAIDPVDPPVIYAIGHVPAPLSHPPILGLLAPTHDSSDSRYLVRMVRVNTRGVGLFTKAMLASDTITLNGNRISTDSFDSGDPLYSTFGHYDAAKARDHGDIATISGFTQGMNTGNAKIKGDAATGPNGTIKVGSNGSLGDAAWVDSGTTGIQPGHTSNDMNVDIFDVDIPFTSGYSIPIGAVIGKTNYNYILLPGDYKLSSFSGKVYVAPGGVVRLWVTDTMNFSGQDYIYLAPGATLELYVGAATASLSNVNNTGTVNDFTYWGLPSNKTLNFGGNSSFTGLIYAPEASFNLGGGGNNDIDFVGACVVQKVKMNGHFKFHYDEGLRRRPSRYVAVDWNEL